MADGILNPIEQLEADFDFEVYTKQEVDALLDEKADKSDTYTKTETDALLDDKADAYAVYTKTETDTLLSAKADKSTTLAGYGITDAYTKTQTDNLLNGKADADSVYTKQEIDTKIPSSVGSATKPVYVNGGVVSACTYELNKTVPANAVFTDTTYSAGNGLNLSGTSFSAKAGANVTVDGNGINVNGNGVVASADSGLISGGTAYTELRPTLDGTWVKNAQTTAINLQKLEGGIEYLYAILSKQYDQLKKYINGNYYDYDTDTDSAYTKTVPSGAMPYASLDSIGGRTVAWNQLNNNSNATSTESDITFTNNGDGSWTINGTATADDNKVLSVMTRIVNHQYYVCGCPSGGSSTTYNFGFNGAYTDIGGGGVATANNTTGNLWFNFHTGDTFNNVKIYPKVVDLTLEFGAGNEPTADEFNAMFPNFINSNVPYNAGTLLSAGVTEVKSVGKNLAYYGKGVGVPSNTAISNTTKRIFEVGKYVVGLTYNNYYNPPSVTQHSVSGNTITVTNSASGYGVGIPFNCLGGNSYTINLTQTGGLVRVGWYAEDGTYIEGNVVNAYPTTLTAPSGARQGVFVLYGATVNVQATFQNVIIAEGTTATYVPAKPVPLDTYSIPAEIRNLEGYGWSAGTAYNYIDYERKVFVKKVGAVDMGSLGWTYNATRVAFNVAVDDKVIGSINVIDPVVIVGGTVISASLVAGKPDLTLWCQTSNTQIFIKHSSYTDGTTFATAMSGKKLFYELATPIETDISAYLTDDNLIEVEADGTLTFENQNGDDYRIPVPSAETYMVDLQASL